MIWRTMHNGRRKKLFEWKRAIHDTTKCTLNNVITFMFFIIFSRVNGSILSCSFGRKTEVVNKTTWLCVKFTTFQRIHKQYFSYNLLWLNANIYLPLFFCMYYILISRWHSIFCSLSLCWYLVQWWLVHFFSSKFFCVFVLFVYWLRFSCCRK